MNCQWLVRKANCVCHRGQWIATCYGAVAEFEVFDVFELALRYAVNPRFRIQWKAGKDLAHQFAGSR